MLGLGAGAAARFAKAPVGIFAFFSETKVFPQREAEGLRPPPSPPEEPPPCGFAKRDAAPAPGGRLKSLELLIFFEK
jgi:hypothetical protein